MLPMQSHPQLLESQIPKDQELFSDSDADGPIAAGVQHIHASATHTAGLIITESLWSKKGVSTMALLALDDLVVVQTKI